MQGDMPQKNVYLKIAFIVMYSIALSCYKIYRPINGINQNNFFDTTDK